MTDEDIRREQNEALLAAAVRPVFVAINQVLEEELRGQPEVLRRIRARLIGLEVKPSPTKKPWRPWRQK